MAKPQTKASAKYNAKTYDDLRIRVKKGKADKIKAYAESKGMSLNGYINHLIESDMNTSQSKSSSDSSTAEPTNIELLNLSIRTYNAIKRTGLNTVEDVTRYINETGEETAIKQIGQKNYKEYVSCLNDYNSNR